jgi:hypothetical protein
MNKPLQWLKWNVLKATETNCSNRKKYAEIIHETAFLNNQRIMRRGQEMILDQDLISYLEKIVRNPYRIVSNYTSLLFSVSTQQLSKSHSHLLCIMTILVLMVRQCTTCLVL